MPTAIDMTAAFSAISAALSAMIGWFTDVSSALIGSALFPFMAVGVGVTLFTIGMKFFKKLMFGMK
jgi:hypothetical protein